MERTKELLKKEIAILTEARDGVGKAFNIIKRDTGKEDSHLRGIYNDFDRKINDYSSSVGTLEEEYNKSCSAS